MFPNIDNATIDRKLRENNNSLEDTTMALLSLPTTNFCQLVHKINSQSVNGIKFLDWLLKSPNFLVLMKIHLYLIIVILPIL